MKADVTADELMEALRGLRPNVHFDVLIRWVEQQLQKEDMANRVPGHENQRSAAQAYAKILSEYDAASTTLNQ